MTGAVKENLTSCTTSDVSDLLASTTASVRFVAPRRLMIWRTCASAFLFYICHHYWMRRAWEPRPPLRYWKELVEFIADAVRLYLHQFSDADAKAVAENVIQVFKM